MSAQWWHVYGGEIPDLAVDEDGNLCAAWQTTVFGESTKAPKDARADVPSVHGYGGGVLTYLASFDHAPTVAEQDALTPPRYREVAA